MGTVTEYINNDKAMNRNSYLYKFLKKCENPNGVIYEFFNTLFCMGMECYGAIVYRKISRENKNTSIFLLPTASIGDIYFIKKFCKVTMREMGINDYLILVDKRNKRIINELNVDNCICLKSSIISALNMHRVAKKSRILDLYPMVLFDHYNALRPIAYNKYVSDKKSNEKTVVLSPYEQTLTVMGGNVLPIVFWKKLVIFLQSRGYTVYTNCNEMNGEMPICGTKGIFPKVVNIVDTVDASTWTIGTRSGFFDYASGSSTSKIVLYPSFKYLRKWSIKRIWDAKNTYELVYGDCNYKGVLEQVCNIIGENDVY